jgi:hypothetical protein
VVTRRTIMAGVTSREVINFFKTADLELAELVMELSNSTLDARNETRAKISANLKKARAARKPAGSATTEVVAQASTVESATPVTPVIAVAEVPAPVAHTRRGRPAQHEHQVEQTQEASA